LVKRLPLAAIMLTLLLGLLPGGHVRAQNQISNFRLSNVANGEEIIEFASLTPAIYVIFDYADADNIELTVEIKDGSGYTIFEKRDTYNGSGTRSLRVSGEDVFQEYETLAQTYGTTMEGYTGQAVDASSPSVARALVELAVTSGSQLDGVLWTLSSYDLSPAADDYLAQAQSYLDQTLGEGQEIINVSITPDDQVASRTEVMQSLAQQALDNMDQAIAQSSEEGKTFLDGFYTATIYQESNIVDSIEWEVSPHGEEPPTASPTPSPSATLPPTPTRTPLPTATQPSAQPTATRTSLPPTATRTPRPDEPTWTPRPSNTPLPELPTSSPTTAAYPGATPPTPPPGITETVLPTSTAPIVISTPTELTATTELFPTATTELFPPATVLATPTVPEETVVPLQTLPVSVTVPAVATTTGTVVLPPATSWLPLPTATPAPSSRPLGSSLNTLGILGGAVALGLVALWIRKNLNL
jgi:hypothetical protein